MYYLANTDGSEAFDCQPQRWVVKGLHKASKIENRVCYFLLFDLHHCQSVLHFFKMLCGFKTSKVRHKILDEADLTDLIICHPLLHLEFNQTG